MSDKNLLKQLNSLKGFKADLNFKKDNKEILLNQIYSGDRENIGASFSYLDTLLKKIPLDIFKSVPHSAFVGAFVLIFLFGGSLFGMHVARDAQPGDSLYMAKIAREKTQFVFTFDEKKKAELGLEFAGNRAKELSLVLNDNSEEEKNEKVSKLVDDFKKEIKNVKVRIKKISENNDNVKIDELKPEEEKINLEDEGEVFSASVEKDERGIEISKTNKKENNSKEEENEPELVKEDLATTTEIEEDLEESEINQNPEGIINEAKELLEDENYNEVLNKITEAETAINQVDSSKEEEINSEKDASSTEDILDKNETASSSEE